MVISGSSKNVVTPKTYNHFLIILRKIIFLTTKKRLFQCGSEQRVSKVAPPLRLSQSQTNPLLALFPLRLHFSCCLFCKDEKKSQMLRNLLGGSQKSTPQIVFRNFENWTARIKIKNDLESKKLTLKYIKKPNCLKKY